MRTSSDKLFRLIQSMTRSERRYFTLFAGKERDKKMYAQLFEAIAQQRVYDERAIVEQLDDERLTKNFSYVKNYLYTMILKALRQYHSKPSVEAEVHDLFRSIEILYGKRLFDQCWKLVERARKLLEGMGKYGLELILYRWEHALLRAGNDLDILGKVLERDDEFETIEHYRNYIQYGRLSQRMFIAIRKNRGVRKSEQMASYQSILSDPLLQDEELAITFDSKAWFHDLHGVYARISRNIEKEHYHRGKLVELLESNPSRISAAPRNYIVALSNVIEISIRLHREKEALNGLAKMQRAFERYRTSYQNNNRRHFELSSYSRLDALRLILYYVSGRFTEGIETAAEIEQRFTEIEDELNAYERSDYWYNLALFYFGVGDFNRSLFWIRKYLHESSAKMQRDFSSFTRIMHVVIHIELGNREVLEFEIGGLKRHLKQRENLYRFEEYFVQFLRSLQSAVTKEDTVGAYRSFASNIAELGDNPYETKVLNYFDFNSWIRSKIEDRSFAEIVQEKFGEKVPSIS